MLHGYYEITIHKEKISHFVDQQLTVTVHVGEAFLWSAILNVQLCHKYWPPDLVPEVGFEPTPLCGGKKKGRSRVTKIAFITIFTPYFIRLAQIGKFLTANHMDKVPTSTLFYTSNSEITILT